MKKNIVRVNIIACLMLSLVGCNSQKELGAYKQGVEFIKEENYTSALASFQEAEKVEKNLRNVYRGEGLAYLGMGQYDNALSSFKMALSESNGIVKNIDYDINFYMAVAEYKLGNLSDAIDTYTAILAVDKSNAEAYYMRGKVKLDLGDIDGAKEDYDQAVLLNKDDSRLYINIYNDLYNNGYENDAKVYVNTGLTSISRPSQYELGIFNYYLGDYTQARNYFEESSETKKTEEGIIYLGKTYEALDDSDYAVALFEEYTNNNKTAAMVYNELGLLKANRKDYEGAAAAFEAGIAGEGTSCRQPLFYNRIVAYEFAGDFSKAKSLMQDYLNMYPEDKSALRENVFLKTR